MQSLLGLLVALAAAAAAAPVSGMLSFSEEPRKIFSGKFESSIASQEGKTLILSGQ